MNSRTRKGGHDNLFTNDLVIVLLRSLRGTLTVADAVTWDTEIDSSQLVGGIATIDAPIHLWILGAVVLEPKIKIGISKNAKMGNGVAGNSKILFIRLLHAMISGSL